jgi:hypothetical protein
MLKNTVLEARGIWKTDSFSPQGSWLLQGADLVIMEGDFISLLDDSAAGRSALLGVLSFREKPEKGTVLFEGRVVGRGGPGELEQMRNDRVLLLNGDHQGPGLGITAVKRLAVVLLNEPAGARALLREIQDLCRRGVAVVLATAEPEAASLASAVYKRSEGKLVRL